MLKTKPSKFFIISLAIITVCIGMLLLDIPQKLITKFRPAGKRLTWINEYVAHYKVDKKIKKMDKTACEKILAIAKEISVSKIDYDPAYVKIAYPGGDVPIDKGVCADVIVRSLRAVDSDLQKLIYIDQNNTDYPAIWYQSKPDSNIDHRRVPNIMFFLDRYATNMPLSKNVDDYKKCDIVAWDLGGGLTHIGIVSEPKTESIIHHISGYPSEDQSLFKWRIIGHYRLMF